MKKALQYIKKRFHKNTDYLQRCFSCNYVPQIHREDKPRILIASTVGGINPLIQTEVFLGAALRQRDVDVDYILCDGTMTACLRPNMNNLSFDIFKDVKKFRSSMCDGCLTKGKDLIDRAKFRLTLFSAFISENEVKTIESKVEHLSLDDLSSYKEQGINVGEHARAGALRYLAKGELENTTDNLLILKKYVVSALITLCAINRAIAELRPTVVLVNHGIYVPHGIIVEACKTNGVRVVTWNVGYRDKTFLFAHDDTYHHAMLTESLENWNRMKVDLKIKKWTEVYLRSRRSGVNDWVWFHNRPNEDIMNSPELSSLARGKPVVTLLTNVFWDAQLHFSSNLYKDMLEWLIDTITYFKTRNDLSLVIRIHPAELRGTVPSRQLMRDEINRRFERLPSNVHVIGPDSDLSTYALCEISDAVLIYGTKTGCEIAALGIPVIVAGEAWIKGKGFCDSPRTREEYLQCLDKLPLLSRISPDKLELAQAYAYHFFRRRFIEIAAAYKSVKTPPFEFYVKDLKDLDYGADDGLDAICSGIIYGDEFIHYGPTDSDRPVINILGDKEAENDVKPWSKQYSKKRNRLIESMLTMPDYSWLESRLARRPQEYGLGLDERVIEIPWVASKLWRGNHRPSKILDAGCAFYKLGITRKNFLPDQEVCLIALDSRDMNFDLPGCKSNRIIGDIRDPIPTDTKFDSVVCISTLEHVGMDNTHLYTSDMSFQEASKSDYIIAITNLLACTSVGGTILMTMPFGRAEDHKWLQVFNQSMVQSIEDLCRGNLFSAEYFRHTYSHGWIRSNQHDAAACVYNDIHNDDNYNPDTRIAAAEAVVCIEVIKCKE